MFKFSWTLILSNVSAIVEIFFLLETRNYDVWRQTSVYISCVAQIRNLIIFLAELFVSEAFKKPLATLGY